MARRLYKALHPTSHINLASSPATNVRIIPPPTSSLPPTNTSTTASPDVTELPPAIQAHFSSLVQQLIRNATQAPAQGCTQANLSPASDCSNNAAPANTQPSNFNAATPTFTQLLNSTAGTTSQPFITPPYQIVNQQASNISAEPTAANHLSTTMQATSTTPLPLMRAATPPFQPCGPIPTGNTMQPGHFHQIQPHQLLAASTLPPVPAQLHQQIVQGEYIDFSTLLAKTMFVDTMAQSSSSQQSGITKISSFATWMEAWNIYLSILLSSNPGRALELVGYQRLICSANQLLPLNAWLQYDSKFRTIAASNSYLRWDQCHPDLWLEALALGNLDKQSSKRWPCPYCKATTHFPENCPRSPFRDNLQSARTTNRRASIPPICGDFNNGNCSRRVCSFKHICLSCKGNHPRVSCSNRRPPSD